MAAPIVYKSTDASAPVLDGSLGSLITVLKACLVNGYPGKSAAGWTAAIENTGAYKIILKNSSNVYFRVQDNGRVGANTGNVWGDVVRGSVAVICGMTSYSDIDTPIQPFPRVMAGGTLHDLYAYGVTIRKCGSVASPSNVRPWMIVADSKTCHLITTSSDLNSSALPVLQNYATNNYINTQRGVTSFGDLKCLNPANNTTATAFIASDLTLNDPGVRTDPNNGGDNSAFNGPFSNSTLIWLNKSQENGAVSVQGGLMPLYNLSGGESYANASGEGNREHFPSPADGGISTSPFMVYEKLNDPIRVNQVESGKHIFYTFGMIPGLLACHHTTCSNDAYRIGNELTTQTDTVTARQYLIYSMFTYTYSAFLPSSHFCALHAFDLQDWWL